MTRIVGGMEIEQNLIGTSGNAEIDDDTAGIIREGRSYTLTAKVHLTRKSQQPGGQHTSPREVFTMVLDGIDDLADGGELTGQLQIGDDPATPSDDD